jgi:uncharacterized protein (DUF427 family)
MEPTQRGRVRVERSLKRVRAYLGAEVVVDTTEPRLVWEKPYYPTYYVPLDDVRSELVPTERTASSPSRGVADIFDVRTKARTVPGAASRYSTSEIEDLRGLVRLDFAAMDEWLEEDEPIYTHPRDPYTRIDILASSRHLRVVVDEVVIADSRQPRILFETGLPPRYYVPLTDVRLELLKPSDHETHCPYKGTATYWSVETGAGRHENLVWIYRSPFPEAQKVAGMACFQHEKMDLYLDGERQEPQQTPFA